MTIVRPRLALVPVLVGVAALVQGCASYKTIDQATTDLNALEDRVVLFSPDGEGREDGGTAVPYLKALKAPPKRVALVTFSVTSPVAKTSSGGWVTGTTLSQGGAVKVATVMKKKALSAIKKTFKANGMEVLEPKEFLTDDAKKSAYNDFTVKIEGAAALLSGITKVGARAGSGVGMDASEGAAEGYQMFDDITNVWQFSSVSNSIGGLAKELGVDAVLLVTNEVGTNNKNTWLQNVRMYMYGPNPVAIKEEDLGTGLFKDNRSGHLYAAAMVKKGFKDTYIEPQEESARTSIDDEKYYNGYERILQVMSGRVSGWVKARATGADS